MGLSGGRAGCLTVLWRVMSLMLLYHGRALVVLSVLNQLLQLYADAHIGNKELPGFSLLIVLPGVWVSSDAKNINLPNSAQARVAHHMAFFKIQAFDFFTADQTIVPLCLYTSAV